MSTRKDKFSKKDAQYMKLALNLARARHGLTGENPSVGSVIVKNDEIISIGQTSYNGRPHSEFNAIKNCNENLSGSTMYITLEPCNHYGKTPPCTKEIIKNKISHVIYSIEDIDQKVKGKSFQILKSKNIIVKKGLLSKDIKKFYIPYFFNRKKKLPYVTGKIAVSDNNLIYSEYTKRITNIHSDQFAHLLRYKNDSILISYKTLNNDNPKLNCRIKGLNKFSPRRIVLDKNLKMKTNSFIFKTIKKSNTIIIYNYADKSKISHFKKKGAHLIKLNLNKNNFFEFKLILKKLYALGCRNLLVEGGNVLSKDILRNRLFNEFYLFKSQKKLSKLGLYKKFNFLRQLKTNYKMKSKINLKFGKDVISVFRK